MTRREIQTAVSRKIHSERSSLHQTYLIYLIWLPLVGFSDPAAAQLRVTAPEAGSSASYRNAVIEWDPIPGVSVYHLEVDDDPGFGSPEVDVSIPGTTYSLSGEELQHGQFLSWPPELRNWPQYVRINGERWDAGTFAPLSPCSGCLGRSAVAVRKTGEVLLIHGSYTARVVSSEEWSVSTVLSADEAFFIPAVSIQLDAADVAHAFWIEWSSSERAYTLIYANSGTNWRRQEIAPVSASDRSIDVVAFGGRIEAFVGNHRFVSLDGGETFLRARIPYSGTGCYGTSKPAGVDAAGTVYLILSRNSQCDEASGFLLQRSTTGFEPEFIAAGRPPGASEVTPDGVIHVVRSGFQPDGGLEYSNSTRGFAEWTQLPLGRRRPYRLVSDVRSGILYLTGFDRFAEGIEIASSLDNGVTWESRKVLSDGWPDDMDTVVDQDGVLHVAWEGSYANSLGAFRATNFPPTGALRTPATTDAAIGIRTSLADPDSDALSGRIEVGSGESRAVSLAFFETVEIFPGRSIIHWIREPEGVYIWLSSLDDDLEFRLRGEISWRWSIPAYYVESDLPTTIEVRTTDGSQFESFEITAWDYLETTPWDERHLDLRLNTFTPFVEAPFAESDLPEAVDIRSLPDGPSRVRLIASDGVHHVGAQQSFSKTGQASLLLGGIQSAVPGKRIALRAAQDDEPAHFEAHLELREGIMVDRDPREEVTTVAVRGFGDENSLAEVIDLDPRQWRAIGTGQKFHYLDPSGSRAGIVEAMLAPETSGKRAGARATSPPEQARSGHLWIRGVGAAVPWSPPSRIGRIRFDFSVGSETVCALFSEDAGARIVEDGPERFMALHAPATASGCEQSN